MNRPAPDNFSEGLPEGEPQGAAPDRIPEHLVDRFFDRDLDEDARRAFLQSLPKDLDRCEDVAKTRRVVDLLRDAGVRSHEGAPDLTGRIIAAVDRRRGFASQRVRRLARVARLGLAAGLVLFVGAVAAVERVAPDATRLAPAPAPLTSALRESRAEMASTLGSLASTVETIQLRVEGVPVFAGRGTPHASVHIVGHHAATDAGQASVDGVSLDNGRPGKRTPGGPRMVVVQAQSGAVPGRSTVGLAFSIKQDPRVAAWTVEMAPTGTAPSAPARMIDADGRCSAFVLPLGVERGDGGPFVLPGQAVPLSPVGTPLLPRVPRSPQP